MRIIVGEKGGHWYTADGRPCHTVIGVNGRERHTTLRDARKLRLLPSVTAITKLWPSDSLRNWLREQDILAAATTPRFQGETDATWIARVIQAADEESEAARVVGSRRHELLHGFHRDKRIVVDDDYAYVEPYLDWLKVHVSRMDQAEYTTMHNELGYAGTIDLRCTLMDGRSALIDLKNRKGVRVYDTDAMQLMAYAEAERSLGAGVDTVLSIILGTSRPEIFVQDWAFMQNEAWDSFLLCHKLWTKSKNYNPAVRLAA